MKKKHILSAWVALSLPLTVLADETKVEVMLTASLDEARHYCLDIAGGQGTNAPLNKGLQAHTCYNYRGRILEDQGFDLAQISEGKFRLPYFDVCMAASSAQTGAAILLMRCDESDVQSFKLQENGQLSLSSKPDLCVTVSRTEKKNGRGGTPVHMMRPLNLQDCSANNDYQAWSINSL